jgi:hypothetical protein
MQAVPDRVMQRPALTTTPFVFVLRKGAPQRAAFDSTQLSVIPNVDGFALRDAVARLHAAGFQVRVQGSGIARGTKPAAGELAAPRRVLELDASEVLQ